MTAEVAVMNRLAVALAADSAVTISRGDTSKVFPSDNKIFELSSARPIGLMTYHSTQFFGVPWEIIAKDFRKSRASFYCSDLFGWVTEFKQFIVEKFCPSEEDQKSFVESIIKDAFREVVQEFGRRQFALLFSKNRNSRRHRVQDQEHRAEFNNSIEDVVSRFARFEHSDTISESKARDWLAAYQTEFDALYKEHFSGFPLRNAERTKLEELIVVVLKSSRPGEFTTGLVFAGFGEDELFPSLQCIEVNGVVAGNLRVVELERADIDRSDNTAAVIPFADRDTVDSLLFGRSADYESRIVAHFEEVIRQVGDAIVDDLGKTASKKADYKERVRAATSEAIERFKKEVAPDIDEAFSGDILDIVRHMPKQEIASPIPSFRAWRTLRQTRALLTRPGRSAP